MENIPDPKVRQKFQAYPDGVREKMLFLRRLVLETAQETDGVGEVEETLKWGEPSYLVKGGSTVRMDWKERSPDQVAFYFNCQSALVETFRELYPERFRFEGNRAVVLGVNDDIPVDAVKHCVSLALVYHKIKHLPMLGA